MKRLTFAAFIAALLFVACNSDEKKPDDGKMDDSKKGDSTASKDKMDASKPETYTMPDSATMMKNWMAYATPGEAHKMLAKSSGTWTTDISVWEAPGGPVQKMSGTCVNKMILGGKYQVGNHTGTAMGMPFEGISTTAYDNLKKVMISTWIDNMGTGIMVMEGPWDDATKSSTMTGKMVEPSIGKEISAREVFKIIDDNTQTMEMYRPASDGKEYKSMEIKYTRKK
jgi:Protein of unknown function (DUF1579)